MGVFEIIIIVLITFICFGVWGILSELLNIKEMISDIQAAQDSIFLELVNASNKLDNKGANND